MSVLVATILLSFFLLSLARVSQGSNVPAARGAMPLPAATGALQPQPPCSSRGRVEGVLAIYNRFN